MARNISKTEGLFVGYTSGAALQGMEQYAAQGYFTKDSVVVVIFPDHGSRYMSKIYSEDWMNDQGFLDKKTQAQETAINYIK